MKKSHIITFTALTVATSLGAALVHAKSDASEPSEKVQVLERLVGTWKGSVKYDFGGAKGTGSIEMKCQNAAGGLGITCQSKFAGLPGGASAQEQDLFGYDPGSNKYHWFAVTSMGETHDHVAEPPKNGVFTWVYRGRSQGKQLVETIVMKHARAGRVEFRNETRLGGQLVGSFSGAVTRR